MLRIALQRAVAPSVRRYSQKIDVMEYLARIEAATKITLKPYQKPRAKPSAEASQKNAQGGAGGTPRGPARGPARGTPRSGAPRNNGPRVSQNAKQNSAAAAGSRPTNRSANQTGAKSAAGKLAGKLAGKSAGATAPAAAASSSARAPARGPAAPRPASASSAGAASAAAAESEWSTLDSVAQPKQIPRGNRRPLRSGSRPIRRQPRTTAAPKRVGARAKVDDRSYVPYLRPSEALNVVLRNEGTSSGGFITPFDVSLPALQPNLVDSAATYNTRVRSLLNQLSLEASASPSATTSIEPERMHALARSYVSGDSSSVQVAGPANRLQLLTELNRNSSLSADTRRFLADVGAGKVAPKQIAAHR